MRIRLVPAVAMIFALGLAISALARQSSSQQNQKKVPDKYYELLGRANYAFQHAKNKDGYAKAAQLFQQAAAVAPWLPDTYYNLGEAQKSAEEFSDAVASLQHYLELKPNASDRDKVKIEIDELKGEAQQAAAPPPSAEQPSSENAAAQRPKSDADFIRSLNGARYVKKEICGGFTAIVIDGDEARLQQHLFNGRRDCTHFRNWFGGTYTWQISGRTIKPPPRDQETPSECAHDFGNANCYVAYEIHRRYIESDYYVGGEKLTESQIEEIQRSDGIDFSPQVYDRQQ